MFVPLLLLIRLKFSVRRGTSRDLGETTSTYMDLFSCATLIPLIPAFQAFSYSIIAGASGSSYLGVIVNTRVWLVIVIIRTWALYLRRVWVVALLTTVFVMALAIQSVRQKLQAVIWSILNRLASVSVGRCYLDRTRPHADRNSWMPHGS